MEGVQAEQTTQLAKYLLTSIPQNLHLKEARRDGTYL